MPPRVMRGVLGDCVLVGRSYALGGGGSGDLVTDRSSFTTPYGLSRNDNNEGAAIVVAAPIAIGRQETIAEQSPGVDGTGQPGLGGASLSRSAG